jgi:thiamine biosynthesis protein ThiS
MGMLKISGRETTFADGDMPATIADLLERLGVDAATVVAEIDGSIIERASFASTQLQAGQTIELVRFVPGG